MIKIAIGTAVVVILLAIAFRISTGSSAKVSLGKFAEISVDSAGKEVDSAEQTENKPTLTSSKVIESAGEKIERPTNTESKLTQASPTNKNRSSQSSLEKNIDNTSVFGTWNIITNGHVGKLHIIKSNEFVAGRMWFEKTRRWETLSNIEIFDDSIYFERPESKINSLQTYTASYSNKSLKGTFKNYSGRFFDWTGEKVE